MKRSWIKRKKPKKKRKKKTLAQKLHDRCSALWKEYCHARDGEECQVKKYRPDIAIFHNGPLQVDHCFTRGDKNLFYDVRNGTVVCASCNAAKNFKNKSVDRAIDDIVRRREGRAFEDMRKTNETKTPNIQFNKVWWLEHVAETLESQLIELQDRTDIEITRLLTKGEGDE